MAVGTRIDGPTWTVPLGRRQSGVARLAWRHEPALDGLRGLAVVVVVLFHLGRLQGGFLGVDLFFVLSGFLITGLLATERVAKGRIDLGRFWVRRARRLLPALLVMTAGVAALLLWFTPEDVRAGFRGDALATLGYVANWHAMADTRGYWDMFNQPSPFDHTWSLAIEEQFYLVWPLVAVLVLTRRTRTSSGRGRDRDGGARRGLTTLGVASAAGAAVSLALLAATYSELDTNRAYFGTDTRLGPTLLGAALALFTVRRACRRDRAPSPWVELAAVAALGWMTWSVGATDGVQPWYYRGGLVTFALAAVVVVAAVTGGPPGLVARALSWSPLRALGIISYGIYLWHWPLIVYLTDDRTGLDGVALDVLRVGTTLAIAAASFFLVERPIRQGTLPVRAMRPVAVAGLAVAVGAVVFATAGTVAPGGTALGAPLPPGAEAAGGESDGERVQLGSEDGDGDGGAAGVDSTGSSVVATGGPATGVPAGAGPAGAGAGGNPYGRPPRILMVGDSGAWASGPYMVEEAERLGFVGGFASDIDCSIVTPGEASRMPDGSLIRGSCPGPEHHQQVWSDVVAEFQPDVVVYYLANAGGPGEVLVDGEWVVDCDPTYDRYLEQAMLADVDLLAAGGAKVVVATSPYGAVFDNGLVDCRNDTYGRVVGQRAGTQLVDLNAFVTHLIEISDTPETVFADVIHLSPETSHQVALWLFDEIPELRASLPPVGKMSQSLGA